MRQLAIALVLTAVLRSPAAAAPGDLDPSFGNGGIVIGPAVSGSTFVGVDVALQADRKVVAVDADAFARYDVAGAPDPSFGSGGTIPNSDALRVVIDGAGRIISTGSTCVYVPPAICEFTTHRRLPDGSPDPTFGNSGQVDEAFGTLRVPGSGLATAVAIQLDGKILVGGFATQNYFSSTPMNFVVFRYNENGTRDPTFAGGSYATVSFGAEGSFLADLAVQPGGNIVAVGQYGNTRPLAPERHARSELRKRRHGDDERRTREPSRPTIERPNRRRRVDERFPVIDLAPRLHRRRIHRCVVRNRGSGDDGDRIEQRRRRRHRGPPRRRAHGRRRIRPERGIRGRAL